MSGFVIVQTETETTSAVEIYEKSDAKFFDRETNSYSISSNLRLIEKSNDSSDRTRHFLSRKTGKPTRNEYARSDLILDPGVLRGEFQ